MVPIQLSHAGIVLKCTHKQVSTEHACQVHIFAFRMAKCLAVPQTILRVITLERWKAIQIVKLS